MQVTEWQEGTTTDGAATVTRKMLLTGSTVLLAGDLDVDDFLLACAEQPVVFEVCYSLYCAVLDLLAGWSCLTMWLHPCDVLQGKVWRFDTSDH